MKVLLLLGLAAAATALSIPAADSRVYSTEWNWHRDKTGYLETTNPGAYIKVDFNGSSIGIALDKSLSTKPFCTLSWSIDNGPEQDQQLPAANDFVQLASGLNRNAQHTLYLFVRNAEFFDRWFAPAIRIRILNIKIDDDATLFAPKLAPKRLLTYGGSITEGYHIYGNGGALVDNDAHVNWAFSLALGLEAEVSTVGWSGQGYSVPTGNIPPLWDETGSANKSSWNWLSSQHPRSFETCPDYIVNGHGTNDASKGTPDRTFTCIVGWLTDIRKACPKSHIFVQVPFGRFIEDTAAKAFQAYQAKKADPLAYFISFKDRASAGLMGKGASMYSPDGIHPYYWRSSQLGALMVDEINRQTSQSFIKKMMEM